MEMAKNTRRDDTPTADVERGRQISRASPPDVGANLRRLRKLSGQSLETLARNSGVSRAMLGQIETGKSVPTVTLVWKVAKALGLPLSELLGTPSSTTHVFVPAAKVRTIVSSEGRFLQQPLVAPDFPLPYQFSLIELAPEHSEAVPTQVLGARATLHVVAGTFTIAPERGATVTLHAGDYLLFQAAALHTFSNPGPGPARAYLVVGGFSNGGGA